MAALRAAPGAVLVASVVWPDRAQLTRCVTALAADGLVVHDPTAGTVSLP
jgi:hypothetical protein